MRNHQEAPNLCRNYPKIDESVIKWSVFWIILGNFWAWVPPDYTANSNFSLHEITLHAIDMDKKRAITQFLTLCNHFENRTSIAPSPPKHLQVRHSVKPSSELLWYCGGRPTLLWSIAGWSHSPEQPLPCFAFLQPSSMSIDTALYISGKNSGNDNDKI